VNPLRVTSNHTNTLVVPAPAKVNLFLHVTGRRADGYHLLESLFVLIDLADTVTLTRRDDGHVRRINEVDGVPEADDLTVRAAYALQHATGCALGVDLTLVKRIPQGAGLGGGSSDAASVLLALNRLWALGMDRPALQRVAGSLGADVPFFVGGEHAVARGIGELLTPVTLPPVWLALACADVHVATASIFDAQELTRTTPSAKITLFSESYGRNDLEAVTASRFPPVAEAVAALSHPPRQARMTGSGACVFAICSSAREARDAIARLPPHINGHLARTLAQHPLARFA
jgi:4-diphosphocytidyl-2-C-methyl-D-erythritol kinase